MKIPNMFNPLFGVMIAMLGLVVLGGCAPNIDKLKSEGDAAKLIKALENQDHEIRYQAARALGEIGDPSAVEPLIAALEDERGSVRQEAAIALGEIGDPQAVEPLIASMVTQKDSFAFFPGSIVESLLKLGIGEGDMEALTGALMVLSDSDFHRTIDLVLDDMNDLEVAEPWIIALGESGDTRSAESLLTALGHPDETVRQAAITALIKLGELAIEPLISTFVDLPGDRDNLVRQVAVSTLANIGEPALEPLLAALGDEHWLVRRSASEALGKLGDPQAVKLLLATALEDPELTVRIAAASALGAIGQPGIEPLVATLTTDADHDVRGAAFGALIAIGEPAEETLIHALGDQDVWVRLRAAGVLIELGISDPAIAPLAEALKDSDNFVQQRAVFHLVQTSNARAIEPLIDFMHARCDEEKCQDCPDAVSPLISLGQNLAEEANFLTIENALIKVINTCGDVSLANVYLNSGNKRLEDAAITWGSENGYVTLSVPSVGGSSDWGSE